MNEEKEERKKVVTVRIPLSVWSDFKILCIRDGRQIGDYVAEVVGKEVERRKTGDEEVIVTSYDYHPKWDCPTPEQLEALKRESMMKEEPKREKSKTPSSFPKINSLNEYIKSLMEKELERKENSSSIKDEDRERTDKEG